MAITQIKKDTLVENVACAISEYIEEAGMHPDDKLPSETLLCKKFSVSRTTVREAFRLLQAMGSINIIPNRGAFVAVERHESFNDLAVWLSNHADEVESVFESRLMIEPMMAAQAAERAGSREKLEIVGIATMFEQEAKTGNVAGMVVYDKKFHMALVEATHNTFMIRIYRIMQEAIQNYLGRSFASNRDATDAADKHVAIAKAIMEGNGEEASRIMAQHLNYNVLMVRNLLEATPEKKREKRVKDQPAAQ